MRDAPRPIHEQRIRRIEALANTLPPELALAVYRPMPPVGVVYDIAPGPGLETLRWEAPREKRNITHYLVYCPDERTLIARVPSTQFLIRGRPEVISALVSSWNDVTKKESRKVIAVPAE